MHEYWASAARCSRREKVTETHMTDVTRYEFRPDKKFPSMMTDEGGKYVLYADYERLRVERDKWKEGFAALQEQLASNAAEWNGLRAQLATTNRAYDCIAIGGGELVSELQADLAALREAAGKVANTVTLPDECVCHEAYTSRGLIDPNCAFHDDDEARAAMADLRALLATDNVGDAP